MSSRSRLKSKLRDPLFLCMVGAMGLAVTSSIVLRNVVVGAGPSAASAAEGTDMAYEEGVTKLPPPQYPKQQKQKSFHVAANP